MSFIIAEAGVNHNGQIELALELVRAAAAAGADAVKFQTFDTDAVVTKGVAKAAYQQANDPASVSQYEMLKALELSRGDYARIVAECQRSGIEFLSTAFDEASLDYLVNELGLSRLKIPSGELTNAPFLLAHAQTQRSIILSTGMASLEEIDQALGVIAFGYLGWQTPGIEAFSRAFASADGQRLLRQRVTLLQCTSAYPTPPEWVHLRAMDLLRSRYDLPVGLSDHSEGIHIPIAAVARGAIVLEKHFTLDQEMKGPDHKASLEPQQLREMVCGIRDTEKALGEPLKRPGNGEIATRALVRKFIVTASVIRKGEAFTGANITTKRSGEGVDPVRYWSLLGCVANRDYAPDEPIDAVVLREGR